MNEKDTKITFELTDLSYVELIDTYLEITDFIEYLNKLEQDVATSINKGEEK